MRASHFNPELYLFYTIVPKIWEDIESQQKIIEKKRKLLVNRILSTKKVGFGVKRLILKWGVEYKWCLFMLWKVYRDL